MSSFSHISGGKSWQIATSRRLAHLTYLSYYYAILSPRQYSTCCNNPFHPFPLFVLIIIIPTMVRYEFGLSAANRRVTWMSGPTAVEANDIQRVPSDDIVAIRGEKSATDGFATSISKPIEDYFTVKNPSLKHQPSVRVVEVNIKQTLIDEGHVLVEKMDAK